MHEAFPEISNPSEVTNDPDAHEAQEPNSAPFSLGEDDHESPEAAEGKVESAKEIRSVIKHAFMEAALRAESHDQSNDAAEPVSAADGESTFDPNAQNQSER